MINSQYSASLVEIPLESFQARLAEELVSNLGLDKEGKGKSEGIKGRKQRHLMSLELSFLRVFKREKKVNVPLDEYIARLLTFGQFTYEHLIASLALTVRVKNAAGSFFEGFCAYKLLSASLFIIQKLLDDEEIWFSCDFEKITGLDASLMLEMEESIYKLLSFEISVSSEECKRLMPEFFGSEKIEEDNMVKGKDTTNIIKAENHKDCSDFGMDSFSTGIPVKRI